MLSGLTNELLCPALGLHRKVHNLGKGAMVTPTGGLTLEPWRECGPVGTLILDLYLPEL